MVQSRLVSRFVRDVVAVRLAFGVALLAACSGVGTSASLATPLAPSVDQAEPVPGAPDHGNDPAIVALDIAGRGLCSGALIAVDVVITARHCVSAARGPLVCPERDNATVESLPPQSVRILVGDDTSSAVERARGRRLLVPPGGALCGADIALVLLDEPIDDVQSLTVRPTGAANGDHLRSVSFGRVAGAGAAMTKLVRDHVPVLGTTATELLVGEGPCDEGGCGGPALDEKSGQIVGVASRVVPGGAAASNAYTRTDAFLALIQQSLDGTTSVTTGTGILKAKKGTPDLGANCALGTECSAGACVTAGKQRYCSRPCGPRDACPAHFGCEQSQQGEPVCIEK